MTKGTGFSLSCSINGTFLLKWRNHIYPTPCLCFLVPSSQIDDVTESVKWFTVSSTAKPSRVCPLAAALLQWTSSLHITTSMQTELFRALALAEQLDVMASYWFALRSNLSRSLASSLFSLSSIRVWKTTFDMGVDQMMLSGVGPESGISRSPQF